MNAAPSKKTARSAVAYDSAVATAELRTLRLIKSDFSIEAESIGADQRAWKRGFGCDVARTLFDNKRAMVTGLVVAEAWCKLGRRKIVSLKCSYAVAYDIAGDTDAKAAESFVQRVGKFAVYPYFRAHFAELTNQAGISMGPLPVLKEAKRAIPSGDDAVAP